MGRKTTLVVASIGVSLLAAGTVFLSTEASGQVSSPNKVALLRCATNGDGTITVRSADLTSNIRASVDRDDSCAEAISAVRRTGMKMVDGPQVTPHPEGKQVNFSFVFVACDDDDCDDDDDD